MPVPDDNPHFERLRRNARFRLSQPEFRAVDDVDLELYQSAMGDEEGAAEAERLLDFALEAVAAGRGATLGDPITGLGLDGFYVFIRGCGMAVVLQTAFAQKGGVFIDRMEVADADENGAFEVAIYNRVEPDE